MADLSTERRHGAPWTRNLAIAVSVAVHAVVFLALFWKFGTVPTYSETPVINVELARPFSRKPPRPPPPVPQVSLKPERSQPTSPLPVLSQPAPSPEAVGAVPQPLDATDDAVRLRNALRTRGCDQAALLNLSPAERQACLDRLAKAQREAGQYGLNLDKRGDYAASKKYEPFFARKPKDGCVPSITQKDVAAVGQGKQKQDWGTGVKCAWSF